MIDDLRDTASALAAAARTEWKSALLCALFLVLAWIASWADSHLGAACWGACAGLRLALVLNALPDEEITR